MFGHVDCSADRNWINGWIYCSSDCRLVVVFEIVIKNSTRYIVQRFSTRINDLQCCAILIIIQYYWPTGGTFISFKDTLLSSVYKHTNQLHNALSDCLLPRAVLSAVSSRRGVVSVLEMQGSWPLFVTDTVPRNNRQRSIRRYSSEPWVGVHSF